MEKAGLDDSYVSMLKRVLFELMEIKKNPARALSYLDFYSIALMIVCL